MRRPVSPAAVLEADTTELVVNALMNYPAGVLLEGLGMAPRIKAGWAIACDPDGWKAHPDYIAVLSQSNPDEVYKVHIAALHKGDSCECRDWSERGTQAGYCKHLWAAIFIHTSLSFVRKDLSRMAG